MLATPLKNSLPLRHHLESLKFVNHLLSFFTTFPILLLPTVEITPLFILCYSHLKVFKRSLQFSLSCVEQAYLEPLGSLPLLKKPSKVVSNFNNTQRVSFLKDLQQLISFFENFLALKKFPKKKKLFLVEFLASLNHLKTLLTLSAT